MKDLRKRSLAALLLALLLVLASCGSNPQEVPDENDGVLDLSQLVFMNPLIPAEGNIVPDETPNLQPKIREADDLNPHTVGWLQIPNTDIDEVVLQNPDDTNNSNAYYLRRDFDGRRNDYGSYYVDYRCKTDAVENLATNTIIYGHSFTDNTDGRKLDQMKRFREDPEFALANPYIYFSLDGEDLAWEVFAVIDATWQFHYNNPAPTADEFQELISELQKRSYYIYDTQVSSSDKILTVSTCTYNYNPNYPNDYRYVVVARLVQPDEPIKLEASFELNEERKLPG